MPKQIVLGQLDLTRMIISAIEMLFFAYFDTLLFFIRVIKIDFVLMLDIFENIEISVSAMTNQPAA